MSTQKDTKDTEDRLITPREGEPVADRLHLLRERELQLKLWALRLLIGHRAIKLAAVTGTAILASLKLAGLL